MLTGEIRSKVDQVWNAFWAGGIANPLEVIEQITYLLFIRGLDDIQTREESKATMLGRPVERRVFPEGADARGMAYDRLRWSRFRHEDPATMYSILDQHVFPFLREMGEAGSSHAEHMKGARFTIPTPGLLAKVVDMLAEIPLDDRDTKGDLYEYMLGKIASAGQNGQFRTPRHIIKLMVELVAPTPKDVICDPASGTCGFLVAAGEYLREHHKALFRDAELNKHFHHGMFHGYDFDNTMLRIGSMNMQLHGVEGADIRYRDSLSTGHADDAEKYSLILANPPFAGSLDYETTSADLLSIVKTKKTELLFMALFIKLLKPGGRAAVIVPSGVLENDGKAFERLRETLTEELDLEAVISLPHWVFKPYASVATSILLFKKGAKTNNVFYYRLENDGFSSGADKKPIVENDIPDLLELYARHKAGHLPDTTRKTRAVNISEIRGYGYDLSPSFYLSGYEYPKDVPTKNIGDLFDVKGGNIPASSDSDGPFDFVTSGEKIKKSNVYAFEGPAIVIPTVSSTGHGHASIKNIHFVEGKFSAATITAVLIPRKGADFDARYVYYFLLAHKDEILVPQMRGAANVTLSIERLKRVRIPVFTGEDEQRDKIMEIDRDYLAIDKYERLIEEHRRNLVGNIARFRNAI